MTGRKKRKWPWVLLGLVVIGAGSIIALRLSLPTLVVRVANEKLPAILGADFNVERVSLGLTRGFVHLWNGRIRHPQEFGEGIFIDVPEAWVTVNLASLLKPPIVFEKIIVKDPSFNLIINPDGKLNTVVFESKASPVTTPTPLPNVPEEPSVVLKKFEVTNLSFSFTDRTIPKEPLVVKLAAGELQGSEIVIDGDAVIVQKYPRGSARLTARISQEPFPRGLLGVYGWGQPLENGIPTFTATLQAAGLQLKPFQSILPSGTSKALGGDAVDLSIDFSLSPPQLNCDINVESNGNCSTSLTASGPPDHPSFDTSSVLYSILLHSSGRLGNLVSDLTGTTLGTAQTLGQGTVGILSTFGEGLFKTLKGIFTVNPKDFAEGVGQSTVGVVVSTGKTIIDTAGEATKGVVNATGLSSDENKKLKWTSEISRRWQEAWEKAQHRINEKACVGNSGQK